MMARGLYRFAREGSPFVMMDEPKEVEGFLTRDTYVWNRYQPPYDELPTEEQYKAALKGKR